MLFAHALSLVAGLALMQDPGSAVVRGQVRSHSTGAPLRFAMVEVVAGGARRIQTETDSAGVYLLPDIPSGRRIIRVTHFDHAPHELEVPVSPGQQVYVDFDLELRPLRLPVLTARSSVLPTGLRDTMAVGPTEIGPASVRVLESTPGVAEFGLAEAAREVPGQDPIDPSDVLFVRGGAADLKLVLLNGAPVYAPFHIGGLIDALDMDMLRSAALYLGGAPARYDGGLSYVMDLETRSGRGEAHHGNASMDMLAGRLNTEGPIGSLGSYLIGGRAVHGLGATPFMDDPFPYTYGDALARIDIDLVGGTLSMTGFWNRERVRLDSAGVLDQVAEWGNDAGSIRYRGELGGTDALLTFAAGDFRTELPLSGLAPLVTEGRSRRLRIAADLTSKIGPARLYYGANFDRLKFEQRAYSLSDSTRDLALAGDGLGDVTGLYVDGTITASRRVRLRGGLRADVFSLSPAARIAPRVSASVLLTERASLTLAAGRYRQYVREPNQFVLLGTTVDEPETPRPLTVARATHLVLALDRDLGEGMRLGIEGFYKTFDGLPAANGTTAEASGLDLWIRRSTGGVKGWFGYSLAWVWSQQDPEGPTTEPNYSGRHLVSSGVGGPMFGGGSFDVRVAYGAGLPFTAIPEPEVTTPVFSMGFDSDFRASSASGEPEPPLPTSPNQRYLRLDAQVARTWNADWRGFAFEVTPYIKVLNALDRRDAIFYHFDRNSSDPEPRALAALPVLPVVGLEWKF